MRLTRRSYLFTTTILALSNRTRPALANSNTSFNRLNTFQQLLSPYSIPSNNMTRLAPVISISHGGGPMPVLGDAGHSALVQSLRTRVPQILKIGTPDEPRAIVLVTAHWSTNVPTVSSGEKHELLYDYYGFPKEAYQLKYEAPGSPEVAGMVQEAIKEEGLECWDHGVFIPMLLIHPAATIPIIQLSVLASESPDHHFRLGRALSRLRAQNIAIVGSGFASLHNLRLMFSGATRTPEFKALNEAWSAQVADAAQTEDVQERATKFEGWRAWRGAYEMHPRGGAEHFLPLVVCAGAGGEGRAKSWVDEFMGVGMWSFYWE
ncbi:Extradiol aromatic ring-opening dioxygenase [Westerdykella ornata]|uniref:Extradiol aromatic ring-opening dioxygenase n=1 Tax=Westerdykella ornata TaxID=318751 RepID=A0A6A6JM08_WESOR|nr:Extradiol aromatic ring-opening dioxygenase [Westerdykella ornata]KAF2277265.1 Extradiol aromatic ring-opening dioxygenase [Westerdykella ornata]